MNGESEGSKIWLTIRGVEIEKALSISCCSQTAFLWYCLSAGGQRIPFGKKCPNALSHLLKIYPYPSLACLAGYDLSRLSYLSCM